MLAFGFLPTPTLAAENGEYTVFISFEGFNLGHGFYIEPAAVSVAPGTSALDATIALLEQEGYEFTINDWGMIVRIYGFHPGGDVNLPPYITVELEDGPGDGSLGSFDYTEYAGWMNTVNHYLADVGAGDYILSDGDVIRWQFSVEGWGADLGIGVDRGFWIEPLYEHADKTQLIRNLFADGVSEDARQAALAVIINPLATDADVAAALVGLQGQEADEDITVFVSFEGYNLGHGFYIKPTAISLSLGSSALDATIALLEQEGYEFTINDWGMIVRIHGFHPGGDVNLPPYITVELEDGPGDGSLGSFDYSEYAGWMNTINHYLADVGAGDYILSDGDVIRWQFSVEGWGADLGITEDRGFWIEPLYEHADKTQLIRDMFDDEVSQEARQAALAVIINPLATPEEVANALASQEEPADIEDITDDVFEWVNPFVDVSANDRFYSYVGFVFTEGIMTGTTIATFAPNAGLSRAMAVTLLWRMEGAPTQGTADAFSDVRAGRWYYNAVAWADANGMVGAEGLFEPNRNITVGELAALLVGYATAIGIEDVDAINGIFADFTPGNVITRGEAAVVIQRFAELIG